MKFLAVDVSGVCRAFWEMYQSGRLSDGEAFTASIDRVRRAADGFDRVVLALDVGPSFRKLHCPEYKAKRPDPGAAYRKLVRDVVERLSKDGAVIFPNKGEMGRIERTAPTDAPAHGAFYPEADDVIASLASWYAEMAQPVADLHPDEWYLRILSGDTDTWALVDDAAHIDVEQINGDRKVIAEKDVAERFGGVGSWVTEVKALAGDDGDGYKPFPHYDPAKKGGIAEGKASRLLETYGMTDSGNEAAVVLHWALAPDDDPHVMPDCHERKCLRAGGTLALQMGYACARMLTDLPLDFSRILAEPKVLPLVESTGAKIVTSAPTIQQPSQGLVPAPPSALHETRFDRNALQPRTTPDLWDRADMIFNSRMFPQFKSVAAVATGIVILQEMGYRMGALRHLYDINGRLGFSGALIVATVRRSKTCKMFVLSSGPLDDTAVVRFQRHDMPEPREYAFTEDMAKRLDSKGDPWKKSRHVMKAWAAQRECGRLHWPELVGGLWMPDEIKGGITPEEFAEQQHAFMEPPQ